MSGRRNVWVTGIGLVTSLGEGLDQHWTALEKGVSPAIERERMAPYPFHPLVPVDFDRQIPKRGDQRQMEAWQRIGTYAAGLALDSAGIKGDTPLLSRTDMIVAAGGGEREFAVDSAVLGEMLTASSPDAVLIERLSSDLRPTLFLAQLPNLLAGNISIVHKVTGSSRTFMGEEGAGVAAVSTAQARIATGQSEICLVGGSYNAEREDMLLVYELGGALWRDAFRPVWERAEQGGGMITGSMGAFLVLEAEEHALARGARGIARLGTVTCEQTRREAGAATQAAGRQIKTVLGDRVEGPLAILSGATGAEPATTEERRFLTGLTAEANDIAIRAVGSAIGHGVEAQFPATVALASLVVSKGRLYPPLDASGLEQEMSAPAQRALVTCWGHWRGEGMALVDAIA